MIEQNTEAWLELRKKFIGSSDAPIVMEKSPWSTPYKLWLDKLGFGEERVMTPAMTRGHDLEPIARELFIKETGIVVIPEVAFSKEHPFMMASLDGIDFDRNTICEIKCVKAEFHHMALDGVVPEIYMPQLNHQMIVTGLKKCFYVSYSPPSFKILEVYLDEEEADQLIEKEKEFYQCIKELRPPELTDRDYTECQDPQLRMRIESIKKWQQVKKEAEENIEKLKEGLEKLPGLTNTKVGDIKLSKVVRAGSIDYKSIPIIKEIDLEPYRKSATTYWRIS